MEIIEILILTSTNFFLEDYTFSRYLCIMHRDLGLVDSGGHLGTNLVQCV